MFPKWHILFGAIFALGLHYFYNIGILNSIVVFFASVLIDVDHYIYYAIRKNIWNLSKTYREHKTLPKNHKPMLHIFHTSEFLVLILIFSLFNQIFLFIFIGLLFHSIIDIIDFIAVGKLGCREFFITRYILSKNKSRYF